VGDALHVHHLVLDRQGRPCKACLLSQIDGATRYVPHSYFAFGPRKGEDAVDQEYGLKQVLLSFGLWRIYYVDRGPAYTALSLRAICAELDIRLLHTQTKDAEAKGDVSHYTSFARSDATCRSGRRRESLLPCRLRSVAPSSGA